MQFLRRPGPDVQKLAVFPGTFNPPTRAHLAIAEASLKVCDEVLFVLPRSFPHKEYRGATFEQRLSMLQTLIDERPRFGLATSDRALFIDLARECHSELGTDVDLWFLCGRDAAERIVNWDYGTAGAIDQMLSEFGLLVVRRKGEYVPPPHLRDRIQTLETEDCSEVSATRVRELVQSGGGWRQMVPEEIASMVAEIYGR